MRAIVTGLVLFTVGLVGVGEAAAQARVGVPIIVNRGAPAAAQPAPVPPTADAAGARTPASSLASTPSPTQEIRIVTPGSPGETRILIDGAPTSAAGPTPRGPVQSFGSVPEFSREIHVRTEKDGVPVDRFDIFEKGPEVVRPIIILPQ